MSEPCPIGCRWSCPTGIVPEGVTRRKFRRLLVPVLVIWIIQLRKWRKCRIVSTRPLLRIRVRVKISRLIRVVRLVNVILLTMTTAPLKFIVLSVSAVTRIIRLVLRSRIRLSKIFLNGRLMRKRLMVSVVALRRGVIWCRMIVLHVLRN